MHLSPSIDLIWRLAADEMAAGEFREIQPEHFCMALLKFAEVSVKAPEDAGEQSELAKAVSKDAQFTHEAIQKCGIESTGARRKLRKQLGKGDVPFKGGKVHRSAASRALFESAAKLAQESGSRTLTPLHLLTALVGSPTPAIAQAVLGKTPPPPPPPALPHLEKHGQDLVKQAAAGKLHLEPGLETQCKAVLQELKRKDRRSVLLVSDDNDLIDALAATLANAIAAKDAHEALKGRRLMDISAHRQANAPKERRSSLETAADLSRMRALLAEAGLNPEIILLVPPVECQPKKTSGDQWSSLLRETLSNGKVQFITRVTPSVFTDHLRKDAVWKQRTQAIWLKQTTQGSMPREL